MKFFFLRCFVVVSAALFGGCQTSPPQSGELTLAHKQKLEREIATTSVQIETLKKQIAEVEQKRLTQVELTQKYALTSERIRQQKLDVAKAEKEYQAKVEEGMKFAALEQSSKKLAAQKKIELDGRRLQLEKMKAAAAPAPEPMKNFDDKIRDMSAQIAALTNAKRAREMELECVKVGLRDKPKQIASVEKQHKDTSAAVAQIHTVPPVVSSQVTQERTISVTPVVAPDSEIKR